MKYPTYAAKVIAEARRIRPFCLCHAHHLRAAFETRLGILEAAQRLAQHHDGLRAAA